MERKTCGNCWFSNGDGQCGVKDCAATADCAIALLKKVRMPPCWLPLILKDEKELASEARPGLAK